ncbi:hypothetical protein M436DRAFT_73581 [Aureobasidium namibiae CBS 147.97]|uniref:Aminoglycoside phosphotransferase domain-containing protein n=1 Tax=Aureobasidium namibiae CBS 147.97 TaxID=1043004 RepID=A0A074WHT5_9PEZI|nr:uncharacterized protein M436DRAFT_73581 [Aureobasidium namibiae CBS 147.97]KEQ72645.1 hypothetical protein M436DRAFT_73581 [Aureobasidium namibiae CBS 147.97]
MEANDEKEHELTAFTPPSVVTFAPAEPFESFQNKVAALGPELHADFQDIERVTGGGSHRIIGLTVRNPPTESGFSDSRQAILRVNRLDPYEPVEGEPGWNEDVAAELAAWVILEEIDEAAVLSLLTRAGIKVPNVLACDTTRKNALNHPYLLQTRLPGTTLWKVWDDMSVDDKVNIAGEYAEILAKLDTIRFPKSGRLLYDNPTKNVKLPLNLAQANEIGEKLVVRGFHTHLPVKRERDDPGTPPSSSLYDFPCMHIGGRSQHKRKDRFNISDSKLAKLDAMLDDMKEVGWFESDDSGPAYSIVEHSMLTPFSIMVEHTEDANGTLGWHISGVLQWDDARCIPPVLARRFPAWLFGLPDGDSYTRAIRKFHDGSSLPDAIRKYHDGDSDMIPLEYYQEASSDPLTARIKERFEQVMLEKIYTPQYGSRAMEVYQDDVYGRGRWLRRLASLGLVAWPDPRKLKQVLREWAEFKQTGQVSHDTVFGEDDDSDSDASGSSSSTYAYDHEPFETFQHKISTLGQDLGVGFNEVEHMRGGSFNRVVPVTLGVAPETASWETSTKAIIRIPRVWDGDLAKLPADKHGRTCKCDAHPKSKEHEASDSSDVSDNDSDVSDISSRRSLSKEPFRWEILDEAVLYNLLEDVGIPAPRILAFDVGRRNALKFPYSIQTRLPGVTWISVIDDVPLKSQLLLADELTGIMARLQEVQFESSGRLQCDQKFDTPLQLSLASSSREIKEKLKIWGFPKETGALMDSERTSPCQAVESSLYELLSFSVQDLLSRELQKVEPEGPSELLVRMYFKLEDILQDMDHIGWFSDADKAPSKSVLHHWDLEARNILVEQADSDSSSPWRITGVIDWDSPHALPPVLTMKPPIWLWDASDDAELPEDVQAYYDNDFDWMPLEYYQKENAEHLNADGVEVKQRFEEAIVKALYSKRYGADAHAKYLDDAYGRGCWLRRIWRFASEGILTNSHHRRIEQLDREWTEYKKANAPLKDDPNGHANNMGATTALSGKNTVIDTTGSDGEELKSVNLGHANAALSENNTTEAPPLKVRGICVFWTDLVMTVTVTSSFWFVAGAGAFFSAGTVVDCAGAEYANH